MSRSRLLAHVVVAVARSCHVDQGCSLMSLPGKVVFRRCRRRFLVLEAVEVRHNVARSTLSMSVPSLHDRVADLRL